MLADCDAVNAAVYLTDEFGWYMATEWMTAMIGRANPRFFSMSLEELFSEYLRQAIGTAME